MRDTRTRPPVVPRHFLLALKGEPLRCPVCLNEFSEPLRFEKHGMQRCRAQLKSDGRQSKGQQCNAFIFIPACVVHTDEGPGFFVLELRPSEMVSLHQSGLTQTAAMRHLGLMGPAIIAIADPNR